MSVSIYASQTIALDTEGNTELKTVDLTGSLVAITLQVTPSAALPEDFEIFLKIKPDALDSSPGNIGFSRADDGYVVLKMRRGQAGAVQTVSPPILLRSFKQLVYLFIPRAAGVAFDVDAVAEELI